MILLDGFDALQYKQDIQLRNINCQMHTERWYNYTRTILDYNEAPLNWTFKVPRFSRLGREVRIGFHKRWCAHREPGVDIVIGEVAR